MHPPNTGRLARAQVRRTTLCARAHDARSRAGSANARAAPSATIQPILHTILHARINASCACVRDERSKCFFKSTRMDGRTDGRAGGRTDAHIVPRVPTAPALAEERHQKLPRRRVEDLRARVAVEATAAACRYMNESPSPSPPPLQYSNRGGLIGGNTHSRLTGQSHRTVARSGCIEGESDECEAPLLDHCLPCSKLRRRCFPDSTPNPSTKTSQRRPPHRYFACSTRQNKLWLCALDGKRSLLGLCTTTLQ
jgi:hypothetical protein